MFKRTAVAGLIPALVVTAVLMVAFMSPVGASRATVFSTSCDSYPYTIVTANITASPAQPQQEGTAVVLSATSTGCTNPEYKFFLMAPGGSWVAASAFGGPTYNWNTTNARDGYWGIGVWVRQIGSTRAYASYSLATYRIIANCTSASLTTSPSSPVVRGTAVTLTGSSSVCRSPQYQFWIFVRGYWLKFGPYTSSPTQLWKTSGYLFKKGRYTLGVLARQVGSTHRYDTYALITFYIV